MKSDFSAITADFSDAPSASPNLPTLDQSTVWTNEKHKQYLDLLESSFLDQLNGSRSLSRLLPQEKSWESCSFPCTSGMYDTEDDQVMVLHQLKMNTESNEQPLDSTADSEDTSGSPWIHHFRPAAKWIRSKSSRPQDVLGEEDDSEENMEKPMSRQRGQGSNSNLIDNTSLDQVVPFGTLDGSANINTCSRKGKKRFQSGCLRRSAAPKKLDMS